MCEDANAAKRQASALEAAARTCIINGQVDEVTWAGGGPLPGLGEAKGLGSTLSGSNFKVYP